MMQPNDVLRRLRYALDLRDTQLAEWMSTADQPVTADQVTRLLHPEQHVDAVECTPEELELALDGLIVARRGPPDPSRPKPQRGGSRLTNNMILKKLRIALELKEGDMLQILADGGKTVRPPELSALFRKPEHKHYRPCGDQLLRTFLHGLALQPGTLARHH